MCRIVYSRNYFLTIKYNNQMTNVNVAPQSAKEQPVIKKVFRLKKHPNDRVRTAVLQHVIKTTKSSQKPKVFHSLQELKSLVD